MKAKKKEYYDDIIKLLKELKTIKPEVEMGKHIATILADYKDIWGISDKDLYTALFKYKAQMELFDIEETFEIEENLSFEEEEEY